MIDCIFTLDYEIYGNGEGSLRELVYEPAEKLKSIFLKEGYRFVVFVEVAELEMIEAKGTDPAIDLVKRQIQDIYRNGFEVGLHLHPQWYNGVYENETWSLDYAEYNLCSLPRERIEHIVDRSIAYLRNILNATDFTPLCFRAGNWLFQPTQTAATVLAARGIKVDSSVFKGGLQHQHNMDYRRALKNGHYWMFKEHVDVPDPDGFMLELPIHTQMVPAWKMYTAKRVGLQRQAPLSTPSMKQTICRLIDLMRPFHPLKFDFCRMTDCELRKMIDKLIQEDQKSSNRFRPIVAIGHTKDLVDFKTIEWLLSYLKKNQIRVSTFKNVYHNITGTYQAVMSRRLR
jgi:hypothetical protein